MKMNVFFIDQPFMLVLLLVVWGQIADFEGANGLSYFPFSFGKVGTHWFIKLMNNAQLKAITNYGSSLFCWTLLLVISTGGPLLLRPYLLF